MAKLVYVDNSNVWIEGKRVSAVKRKRAQNIYEALHSDIKDSQWKIDFGKLLHFAGGEKVNIKKAALFGSKPTNDDGLWNAIKQSGFDVVTYDRVNNKEKKVDVDIAVTMVEDSCLLVDKAIDEIVLVAGDKDYVPAIRKIKDRGVRVVLCFWGHAAKELVKECDEFYNLDSHFDHLSK